MKLKRILSLALSGVLAVSMLTACFGGGTSGNNSVVDSTRAVMSALNSELDTLNVKAVDFGTDRDLTSATATVVRGMVADDVTGSSVTGNTTGAVVSQNSTLCTIMGRYIKYDTWSQMTGAHSPAATDGKKTFVTLLMFDGKMSANGVGQAVADKVAVWNLDAVDSKVYTFDGSVAAYRVTIPVTTEGGSSTTVWVVGLMLEQAPVQSSASSSSSTT